MIDFSFKQILNKMSNDIYDYLKTVGEDNKYVEENKLENINHMFRKGIVIPIAKNF